jgi:hypothetical protein
MNSKLIAGIVLAAMVLAVMTLPAMARTDDVVFYFNTSDGSHEITVAPGDEVTIYFDADAPVNKTGGDEIAVLFDPAVVECLDVTENASVTDWYLWTYRGVFTATDPQLSYMNFDTLDFVGVGPGLLRCGDIRLKALSPGVTTLYLGLYPGDIPNIDHRTMICDPDGDAKDWTLYQQFTFTCVGPTYNISGYTFNNNGDPENSALVKVINLNSSEKWDADVSLGDNSYELTLDVGVDVDAGNILRLIAKDGVEWINVTDHPVTQAEIDAGGVSNVNLTLDEFYLDLNEFPMYEAEATDYNEYCGPAVAKMWLDYMHNSTTQWDDTHFGDMPAMNQDELYTWGIGNNSNTSLPYFDTQGMWYTVQYLDPEPWSEYGYNFGTYGSTDKDFMLKQICKWIAYAPGKKPGHPVHVPAAVPAYGSYENWMAVRGIHTDEDAYPMPPTLEVYGFWVNDPYPASMGGIGENSYKTVDEWTDTYYLPLVTDDTYNGKYVAILEPPEDTGGEITIGPSPARFSDEAAQTVLAARATQIESQSVTGIVVNGVEGISTDMKVIAEISDVVEEADKWIVQAAIDGANEQLAPYDPEFAAIFEDVVADSPLLVENGDADYYLVSFAESYKDSVEEVDAMIADLEAMKDAVPDTHEAAIKASIDELASLRNDLNLDRDEIMVVVIIDADDGHFKEASWVTTPVVYLPTTEAEALAAVGKAGATAELVYMGESPYYPDWKITDGCSVYYVNQQGKLFDADADCDGYLISEGDCDDNNAAVNPGATEVYDGVDNKTMRIVR